MSHHIDHLIKSLEGLSPELRRELARRLESDVLAEVSAADTAKAEKVRVAKIHAMRAEGNNPTFNYATTPVSYTGVGTTLTPFSVTTTPEPTSTVLFAVGAVAALLRRRRQA